MTQHNALDKANKLLQENTDLSGEQMQAVMHTIFKGEASEETLKQFITSLTKKGETVTELTAAVTVLRELALHICVPNIDNVIDVVGTGGDGHNTFNISTAAAIVAASAGARVAKHGNRASSSTSGSADVLASAGVNLDLPEADVVRCIQTCGIGFLFAPHYHPALRHVANARRTLKTRSIFNLLGPLLNPAQAKRHLIGVFAKKWCYPIAKTLQSLGAECALVVHADDGLDEISINSPTTIVELKKNVITEYVITPEQFGLPHAPLTQLATDSADHSLAMIEAIFANQPLTIGSYHIVLLNAAAALYVADRADSIKAGIDIAKHAIDSGQTQKTWRAFIDFTQNQAKK